MMESQRVQSIEIMGINGTTGEFFSRSYDPDGNANDFVSRIAERNYTVKGKASVSLDALAMVDHSWLAKWTQLDGDQWNPDVGIVFEKKL